jgi:isopenicillin N synthase-like dioxygenase
VILSSCDRYHHLISRSSASPVAIVDIAGYVLDQEPDRTRSIDAFGTACAEVGFVVIRGHGVGHELVQSMQQHALEFFAQPLSNKMQCSAPLGTDRFKGYVPFDRMAIGRSSLIEIFQAKPFETAADAREAGVPHDRIAEYSQNTWPRHLPGFRTTWTAYYRAMSRLAAELFEMIALFLGAPRDFFEEFIDRHVSDMAINFYPPQPEPPDEQQLRAQPHTDFGTLTLLAQDGVGGLQIENAGGEWVEVPVVPDSFVVNLGELMTPWTNGRWQATRHRVVNPPRAAAKAHRLSIAFFNKPNYGAVIEPIPGTGDAQLYPAIIAGEWFDQRRRTEAAASAMDTSS